MEEIDKKEYEVAVLLRDEESKAEVLRALTQHNVEVREEGLVKKITLAYPIKHATQAYFVYFYVRAAAADAKLLEAYLRSTASVLRSLIVLLPSVKRVREEAQKSKRPMMPRRPAAAAPAGEFPKQQPQRQSLSNEALTKKIEEILQ